MTHAFFSLMSLPLKSHFFLLGSRNENLEIMQIISLDISKWNSVPFFKVWTYSTQKSYKSNMFKNGDSNIFHLLRCPQGLFPFQYPGNLIFLFGISWYSRNFLQDLSEILP